MDQSLTEMVNCPLCLGQPDDPRMLPCQHTFCLPCIEEYFNSRQTVDAKLICPLCKQEVIIPEQNFGVLPQNLFYKNLNDTIRKGNITDVEDDERRLCAGENCGEMAEIYCVSGCGYLCKAHHDEHKMISFTKNHSTVKPDNVEGVSKPHYFPACAHHPHYVMDLFCETCEVPLCVTCHTLWHPKHSCCELQTKTADYKKRLEHIVARASQLIDCVNKAIEASNREGQNIGHDMTKMRQHVVKVFREGIEKLKREQQIILEELNEAEHVTLKTREEVKNGQDKLLSKLQSAEFYGMRLLGTENPYAYITNNKKLTMDLHDHSQSNLPTFTYSCQTGRSKQQNVQHDAAKVRHISK